MEINKISNNLVNNTIKNTKSMATLESFEMRLQEAMESKNPKELKKACQEFESIFLDIMYRQMKTTIPKSDLIPSDAGREIFDSMLDEQYMSEASKNGSFGLADMLYKQFTKE